MTPPFGFLIAILAGRFVPGTRRAILATFGPYCAVLAVQSYILGSGRGTNPASTITQPPYWVVQLITLGLVVGIAGLLSARGSRRAGASARRMLPAHLTGLAMSAATPIAALLAVLLFVGVTHPAVPQSGEGGMPITGLLGTLACVATLAVLAVGHLRARRAAGAAARQRGVAAAG